MRASRTCMRAQSRWRCRWTLSSPSAMCWRQAPRSLVRCAPCFHGNRELVLHTLQAPAPDPGMHCLHVPASSSQRVRLPRAEVRLAPAKTLHSFNLCLTCKPMLMQAWTRLPTRASLTARPTKPRPRRARRTRRAAPPSPSLPRLRGEAGKMLPSCKFANAGPVRLIRWSLFCCPRCCCSTGKCLEVDAQ